MNKWIIIQFIGFLAFMGSFILLDAIYHIMTFGLFSVASAVEIIAVLPLEHQIIHIVIPILVGCITAFIFDKKVIPDGSQAILDSKRRMK